MATHLCVGGCSAKSTPVFVRRPCFRRSERAHQTVIGAGGGRRANIGAGGAGGMGVCCGACAFDPLPYVRSAGPHLANVLE
eukprot:1771456-Prymnesium_polylepis.1